VKKYCWKDVVAEHMNPRLTRQAIHSERLTIARLGLMRGALVPEHKHENEQVTMLEKGRLKFVVDGEETILEAGEALAIPPDAPHWVEALEDSVAIDVFSPRREDWIRGEDSYLRR
jgi:quercetin dioxygenase-like cupin family protein